jgi:uncharacterized protein
LKDLLIIDGYNFIFNFIKAGLSDSKDLEYLRDKLMSDIAAYNSQKDYDVVVVFDASKSSSLTRSSEIINNIKVIYSRSGETADTIIEELVSGWSAHRKIIVVTSDYSQQKAVFGKNTIRKSCREFGLELNAVIDDIRSILSKNNGEKRKIFYSIEKRLDPGILKKIVRYRKR